MKVITSGRRPQLRGNKVIVTTGDPCLCGDCGGGGGATGACCDIDGACHITRGEAICKEIYGDTAMYQGDGTVCDPNPCTQPETGACCTDGECSILSESDCTDGGGTYQGDDTTCDPNPCFPACCPAAYTAFDGSGRKFLRADFSFNMTPPSCAGGCYSFADGCSGSSRVTINPDTCASTCESLSCGGDYPNCDPCPPGLPCIAGLCPDTSPCGSDLSCADTDCSALLCVFEVPCPCSECTSTITATDYDCVFVVPPPTEECSGYEEHYHATLSNECNPPMGAFDAPFFQNN